MTSLETGWEEMKFPRIWIMIVGEMVSKFYLDRCRCLLLHSLVLYQTMWLCPINSLRPRPNRRHFADDIFKCIFENENEWIWPRISLKFVPKVRINNIPALVQIMAWRRPGDKPLSEPMMVRLPTHIRVTRPQWVMLSPWYYLNNTSKIWSYRSLDSYW